MKSTVNFVFFVVLIAAAAEKGDGDDRKLRDRDDDEKLHNRDDEKLHDRVDKMAEQMCKQNVQIVKRNKQISKLNEELVDLQAQNNKLHQNLKRQADSRINPPRGNLTKFFLKRDKRGTFDVENESFDVVKTLKLFVKSEIKDYWNSKEEKLKDFVKVELDDYLISEQEKLKHYVKTEIGGYVQICVSGNYSGESPPSYRGFNITTHQVDFGYTFRGKPAFSVAVSHFADYATQYYQKWVESMVTEVTNSYAKVFLKHKGLHWTFSWIACL